MSVVHIIKKSLLYIAMLLVIIGSALMMMHIFFNERHFDSGRNSFPPSSQYLSPDAKQFNVALVSDSATGNLAFQKIIQDITNSDKNYSFILYLGDFVKDYLGDYYWMRAQIEPYLSDMPMYSVPGNHDVTRRHHIDKTAYKSVMGAPYYWFGYGDVLFIGLDLSDKNIVDDEMLQWLSDTLRKIRPMFTHCVIYGHIPPQSPVSSGGFAIDSERVYNADIGNKIKSVISGHKIDAMFFGHVHYWSESEFATIPMYTLPASGQKPRGDVAQFGYVSMTIGKTGITNVEPKYIEFNGPRGEKRQAWISDNIGNFKTRRAVVNLLYIIFGCLVGAFVAHCIERYRK